MKGLLAVFTIGLLVFFLISTDLNLFKSKKIHKVGHVVSIDGTVMGKAGTDGYFKNLEAGSSIPSSFQLVTGLNSQATLFFGEEFQVSANSSLELFKKAGRFEIRVLSGKAVRKGLNPVVDFIVDNKKVDSLEISPPTSASLPQIDGVKMQTSPKSSLSQFDPELQKRLQETFKLHQRFVEKCFIKHYERVKGQTQSGQVVMQFKIVQKGQINDISVQRSDYKDEDFHSCLVEVVSRVQLKYFDSQPVTVNFPIELKLPR